MMNEVELKKQNQRGFTLIELLTTIGIIAILGGLSIQIFREYRQRATYAVVEQTLKDARTAVEAGYADADNLPPAIPLTVLSVPGPPAVASAARLLPGFSVPKASKVRVSFDPECTDFSCEQVFLQVRHCGGSEYASWIRFGDGTELTLPEIAGRGCP